MLSALLFLQRRTNTIGITATKKTVREDTEMRRPDDNNNNNKDGNRR